MATIIKLETEKIDGNTTVLFPTIIVEKATESTRGFTIIGLTWLHGAFVMGIKRSKKIAANQENK